MQTLIKIDRFLAWVLFGGFLLYLISGYGMTKGLISPAFATNLHLNLLTYFIFIAFVGHSAFAIHLALIRWQMWNAFTGIFLAIFYLVLIGGFIYVDRVYIGQRPSSISVAGTPTETDVINTTQTTTQTTKTFTLSELAKYNGQNGEPAYVAVDGNIYDLTSVFKSGKHFSHFAGTELTNAFYSYHAKQALAKYPIIGKLVK